jgi:hypothetical protein
VGYCLSPAGVTHGDCELVSQQVGTILDVEDVVPGGRYTLEVSSPGVERKLLKPQDYERFQGKKARITLRDRVDGRRNWEGTLAGLDDGSIALETEAGTTFAVSARPDPEGQSEVRVVSPPERKTARNLNRNNEGTLETIFQSIEILSKEKGIDAQIVLDAVKDAMLIAARKQYRTNEDYVAEMDPKTGAIQLFAVKKAVSRRWTDPATK